MGIFRGALKTVSNLVPDSSEGRGVRFRVFHRTREFRHDGVIDTTRGGSNDLQIIDRLSIFNPLGMAKQYGD